MAGVVNNAFDEENGTGDNEFGTELRRRKSSKTDFSIEATEEDEDASLKPPDNFLSRTLGAFWQGLEDGIKQHKRAVDLMVILILNVLVFGYFGYATYYWTQNNTDCVYEWCDGYGMLIILISITYFMLSYFLLIKPAFAIVAARVAKTACWRTVAVFINKVLAFKFLGVVAVLVILGAFAVFIAFDVAESPERLRSLIGVGVLFLLGFVFSKHPGHIKWRPVVCGLTFQVLLGILTIRWSVGRDIFRCIGEKVTTFLDYAKAGGSFVYSDFLVFESPAFAFAVLPVIFFFSFIISIMYYLGAMQWFVMKLGWVLQSAMGTTVCESLTCAANIFLGMSESPLLIKPYIKDLTHSEIHTVMTSGFATVSGSVLAAYISFGAEPAHLITSSVMAAPAALFFSKLFYPETQKSKTASNNIVMAKSEDSSILDAATNGALAGTQLILGIIANIIAFVAVVAFLNGLVGWLGMLAGAEDLTFEQIFGTIFIPLSWIMGVPWSECGYVGKLIGLKTIVNEFAAYQRLGEYKKAGLLSPRSAAIATYAICGFANPSSMGIMIGALGTMAPSKRSTITAVAFRAFIAGSCICFITASIAGLLMTEDNFESSNSTATVAY